MNRTFVCTNNECADYGKDKTVTLPHMTQNVFANVGAVCGKCEAGYEMKVVGQLDAPE